MTATPSELSPALQRAIDDLGQVDLGAPRNVRPAAPPRFARAPATTPASGPIYRAGAVAMAAEVAARRVDPLVLVEEHLQRIVDHATLNAFITTTPDTARQQVAEVLRGASVLAGVPIAHKDILDTAGTLTTGGSMSLGDNVPSSDAQLVRALRVAGLPLVGKTNTHELATGITGEVSAAGRVQNPWRRACVAGGSSSGSAAAVAAGLVPLATASDTGGSARIPAACCGVVGFKPTYGVLPTAGVIPFSWTLDHVGFMARHCGDIMAAMGVATGRWQTSPVAPASIADDLRYALPEHLLSGAAPAVADAVCAVAAELDRLGARRVTPDWPAIFAHANGIAAAVFLPEGAAVHARTLSEHREQLQPPTQALLASATGVPTAVHLRGMMARRAAIVAADAYFLATDLLLAPTIAVPAPDHTAETVALPDGDVDTRAALTRFTRLWNVCGNPAVSVPCGLVDGLPVGVQLVGARGADDLVLAAGQAYEQRRGPFPFPPGF